jgi:hypothetical protein
MVPTITFKDRNIRLTQRMFDILSRATNCPNPGHGHSIGNGITDREAIERLEAEGLLEVRDLSYRLAR